MLIDPRDLIGRTINRRYKVKQIIGRGGMGHVYLAWDKVSRRFCALKLLSPDAISEASTQVYHEFLERFEREHMIMLDLHHDHIARVYDVGEYQDAAYFVMEYFENGSLYKRIRTRGKLTPQEASTYITQIASALDYIHARNIIHRDIKPQNMLLNAQDELMLADFGVAHIAGSLLTASEQPGTKVYKSPEAKYDQLPDLRDDIYSLGVVLYEMLTGNHPSTSTMRSSTSGIPPEIVPIIQKAIAEHRHNRYASASQMARDLAEAVKQLQRARNPNAPPRRQSPPTRRPMTRRDAIAINPPASATKQSIVQPAFRIGLLILGVVLAIFLLGQVIVACSHNQSLFFSPLKFTFPTPKLSPQDQAAATVQQYYTNWNNKDYQAAYNLLQASYQQIHPFNLLLPDYQQAHHVCIAITSTKLLQNGTVQVLVSANVIEDAPSGGTVISLYYVIFDVQQVQNSWKLAPSSLRRDATPGVCHL